MPPFPMAGGSSFARPVDRDIVKITAPEMFTVAEATRIAKQILEEGGVEYAGTTIEGGKVNNRFKPQSAT